ncbi:MAG TPA: hypothetical protein VJR89_11555 [Polyangiales bacterium]|nr:hypothetical protein [Polyangiales bacterium]
MNAESKPKWLNPLIVSAIVLGSLFGCCGITSVGGVVAGRAGTQAMMQMQNANDPASAELFRKVAEKQLAFQQRTLPLTLSVGVLGLLQSIVLVIAGILAYKRQAIGRRLLVAICAVGIGVEVITTGIGLYLARETSAFTEEWMTAATAQTAPGTDEKAREVAQKFGTGAARVGNVLGIVMLLGFFALKAGYYVFGTLYLRRKEVVDYFENPRPVAS